MQENKHLFIKILNKGEDVPKIKNESALMIFISLNDENTITNLIIDKNYILIRDYADANFINIEKLYGKLDEVELVY